MEYKDYYSTLGVDKKASLPTRSRRPTASWPASTTPTSTRIPEAESKFKEINEAYQVLSDDEKRSKYDQFGSAWNPAQSPGLLRPASKTSSPPSISVAELVEAPTTPRRAGGDFSSFFEMLFGGGRPQSRGRNGAPSPNRAARRESITRRRSRSPSRRRPSGGKREIALRASDGSAPCPQREDPAGRPAGPEDPAPRPGRTGRRGRASAAISFSRST